MFVRQKKAIVFFVFVLAMLLPVQLASADFYNEDYEDNINISGNRIIADITNVYTAGYSYKYRMALSGEDGVVDENDYKRYQSINTDPNDEFWKYYVQVDGDEIPVSNVTILAPDAIGDVNNDTLNVFRRVEYELPYSLDEGEHEVWIRGHPNILQRRVMLPERVTLESAEGLKEMQQTETDGRIVLTGISTTSKYMNGTIQTFEYVTIVTFSKKPWYFNRLVIPILMLMEGLLAIAAIYSLKGKLSKSFKKGNI